MISLFLDKLLPPIIRNNRFFMYPLFYVWFKGSNVSKLMDFKKVFHTLSEEEFIHYYHIYDSITGRESDLNDSSLSFVMQQLGERKDIKIAEIGCGNGFLLKKIKALGYTNIVGSDIVENSFEKEGIKFVQGNIEKLPFDDNEFDITICNNTLEHVVDVRTAVAELKRITKNKLIVTVPCQQYNRYTFDLHIHFFPQKSFLLNLMRIEKSSCVYNGGDWSYVGHLN